MQMIRCFEEQVVELVTKNEIAGVTHEYSGQEAVAVGVCSALEDGDVITSTHRGHGHVLAKGGDAHSMFAELLGRRTGYNKGRGGSMHIADFSLGIYGANGIVGAGVPIACGAAYAFKTKREKRVAVAFFGEGAINQGVVLESLNMAAIWDLPLVLVCENNRYAVSTPIDEVTKGDLASRARSFGLTAQPVDGMDVWAVYEAALAAADSARCGKGAVFLECHTYRFSGHYTVERLLKLNYRTELEVDEWRERDPIELWAKRLRKWGVVSGDNREAIDRAIESEVQDAVARAREDPWPLEESALDYMYAREYTETPSRGWE